MLRGKDSPNVPDNTRLAGWRQRSAPSVEHLCRIMLVKKFTHVALGDRNLATGSISVEGINARFPHQWQSDHSRNISKCAIFWPTVNASKSAIGSLLRNNFGGFALVLSRTSG
jgi:hypothetical protein